MIIGSISILLILLGCLAIGVLISIPITIFLIKHIGDIISILIQFFVDLYPCDDVLRHLGLFRKKMKLYKEDC